MLTAIDAGLGEGTHKEDVAPEAGWVSCIEHSGNLQLKGTTSFDVAFGYASAGLGQLPGSMHLLEGMRTQLVDGFNLGWNVRKLMAERYRVVRNALYGIALAHGTQNMPPIGDPLVVDAAFEGPFRLVEGDAPLLFKQQLAARAGIYLWTVETSAGYRPWYVGPTTRSFAQRTAEHVSGYLSGQYESYSLDSIANGSFRPLHRGPTRRFPALLPEYLRSLPNHLPGMLEVLRATQVFIAPVDGGKAVLDRVEGALGRHFKVNHRDYLVPGQRVPEAIPGDCALVLRTSSSATVLGLPPELREPHVPPPLPSDVRAFVDRTTWTFAKTYATTWPHEYIVKNADNADMLLALARHVFEHGVNGRFYSQVRKYHHEDGKVYWSMDDSAERTTLINRCDESGTYEARLAAGTLP